MIGVARGHEHPSFAKGFDDGLGCSYYVLVRLKRGDGHFAVHHPLFLSGLSGDLPRWCGLAAADVVAAVAALFNRAASDRAADGADHAAQGFGAAGGDDIAEDAACEAADD